MTKHLILMRHAKSSWEHVGRDFDRPLNTRGQMAAPAIGDWLRTQGYLPDAILSSSAKRTRETCDGLGFDVPMRFERRLYLADPDTMLAELKAETANTVLLLGHNPGIAELADQLVATRPDHSRFYDYPTCATTVIDFEISDWAALKPGSGKIRDFIVPKDLK
ncbi:histidine phosphatase family protein [Cognatishimia sp. WU-CL00825]|uniref:SixA phosphatase family protein n=1 Tax=Cognatishimia sp. WU-CL00825 TaxID=3127658 RepID=UPI00310BA66F